MAVMTTGMHGAWMLARIRQSGLLLNRQRIHICPNTNDLTSTTLLKTPYNTSPPKTTMHLKPPRLELGSNQI
ncbi:hypothetical protein D3C72_1408950 [compost metagenome]